MTVGESNDFLGYSKDEGWGELSTGREFNYPPWSPPHKHHFDPDYEFSVGALYIDPSLAEDTLVLEIDDADGANNIDVGNLTLWIRNTSIPLSDIGGIRRSYGFDVPSGPDLDWKEGDTVRVVLSYDRLLPSEPRNVSVTAPPGEGGTLAVSWDEPDDEGTFPIECYLVEFRHPSGDIKKRKQSYPGSRGPGKGCGDSPPTSVKRTDLEPGVRYEVLVQALSGDGFSEWSDMKTAPRTNRGRALGARFVSPPERHDGEKRIKVRVEFSEAPENVGADGVEVEGGAVTSVSPVGGDAPDGAETRSIGNRDAGRQDREVVWEIEIEPDSDGDVTVSLDAGRPCDEEGAICTADGRTLSEGISTTVEGPEEGPPPLTASFTGLPETHDGESAFTFRIAFSERVGWMNGRRLRENVVAVAGGRATSAGRVNRRRDLWQVTVEPDSPADVTVTLSAGAACRTPAAVCTSDGRALSNSISGTVRTVRGPVALSVADARAEEGIDETIDFAVTLSRAASGTVAVAYATADGTATAGEDYTARKGQLTFDPGETEKTVRVPVLDDAIDEGEETFTLRLTNASGAAIADGEATGTIENSDPLQKMWLSRFGRTVADHVVDAVAGRLSAPLAGAQVTLAGQSVDLSRTGDSAVLVDAMTGLARAFGAPAGPAPTDRTALDAGPDRQGGAWDSPAAGGSSPARSVTGRDLLLGSSFHLALDGEGDGGGPGLTAWGRVTVGGFDGQGEAETGAMRMDGEVITGILGADAQRGRWLAGLAFSVSEGEGTFEQPEAGNRGTVESNLTSVNPYLRFEASERLSTWGLLGFGTGEMTMTEAARGERGETVSRTDIEMRLAAVGARGALLDPGTSGGFDLAVKADAFLVETEWEKVSNETDTQAGASRVRLVLEGSRAFELGGSAKLTPGLELGLRHDGGDAETGTGVEVGGSVGYADAASGLSVEARARTLIAHEASGFEEWGASASVRLDHGAEGRGLSFSLAPTLGASSSGVDRLWSLQDARGLAPEGEFEAARSLEAHVGYGLGAFGDRGLAKPYAGLSLGEGGARTWRGGVRWTLGRSLDLGFEGRRNEAANDNDPEHGIGFRLKTRW